MIAPMRTRNSLTTTLLAVIGRCAAGNKSEFAQRAGVTQATISRLCSGSREITRDTLEKITADLPQEERRLLYLAAVRDFLPDDGREMLFPGTEERPRLLTDDEFVALDAETLDFLRWLARDAVANPETHAWLRKLAAWVQGGKKAE